MKKMPAWTHRFVMPLVLTCIMTAIVSAISVIRAVGFGALAEHWLSAWLWSWAIAYPVILCIFPLVHVIVRHIVEPPSHH